MMRRMMQEHKSARVLLYAVGGAAAGAVFGVAFGAFASAFEGGPETVRGIQESWWWFCIMGSLLGCGLALSEGGGRPRESSERHLP